MDKGKACGKRGGKDGYPADPDQVTQGNAKEKGKGTHHDPGTRIREGVKNEVR